MISFLLTIPNECAGGKSTTFMQLVVTGWPFCCALRTHPLPFTPLKVLILNCVLAHMKQPLDGQAGGV